VPTHFLLKFPVRIHALELPRWICRGFVAMALAMSPGWVMAVDSVAPDTDSLPQPVIAALKHHGFSRKGLSLYVHEIGQNQPMLAVSSDAPRYPASTIKLLTTLAALEDLSPAWSWKTEVYTSRPVRQGKLEGDLYLKGYGDPFLTIEHFWGMLRSLRAAGLETIKGNLVLDQSYFIREPGDAAEFDNQPLRAYNVLPSALLVNFQAVHFRFIPHVADKRLLIVADPLPANVDVDNRVSLVEAECRGWARRLGMKVRHSGGRTQVQFTGTYHSGCGNQDLFRVVSDPASYTSGLFRSLWNQLDGRLEGDVREGMVPDDATLFHTAVSPPLADIIRSVNKYSNNVMARQLLLTLGAEHAGPPGTTDKGIQAIHAWLTRHQLFFPELVLENGAGLSREETISARHLGQVLLAGWRSSYMPEFVSSLPLAAMDGTLRRRFHASDFNGRMHLKTGSLNDVRSVAGYVHDKAGRNMVVVCLHNAPRADSVAGEAIQESVLKWVYDRP